jgi:deoxyribose-phosphate aldolase
MHLEYCCYNKRLVGKTETETLEIFKSIGLNFSGVCLPLCLLREIHRDLVYLENFTIACPIDYPLGIGDRKVRQHEALVALKGGANTLDLVMNPYLAKKEKHKLIKKDILPIIDISKSRNAQTRLIINYDLYDLQDAMQIAETARDAGIDTIIPSGGFRNDDIFDNLLFCNSVEEKLGVNAICSGGMWLKKHYDAAIKSKIFGLRIYSLHNQFSLGVSN